MKTWEDPLAAPFISRNMWAVAPCRAVNCEYLFQSLADARDPPSIGINAPVT